MRLILILLALAWANPAAAHALRVFAKEVGGTVSGYGFFIGGGRPKGVDWRAELAGAIIASGKTDEAGAFSFDLPAPLASDLTVTLDTHEGHIASALVSPAGAPQGGAETAVPAAPPSQSPTIAEIEAAIARQITPLQEQILDLQTRLRLADIMSGVFLFIGLAGIALWARGRRG